MFSHPLYISEVFWCVRNDIIHVLHVVEAEHTQEFLYEVEVIHVIEQTLFQILQILLPDFFLNCLAQLSLAKFLAAHFLWLDAVVE